MILKSMTSISSLRHVNLDSYVIVGQLTGDLVAVAKNNPGLETIMVFDVFLHVVTLLKVNNKQGFILCRPLNLRYGYCTVIIP